MANTFTENRDRWLQMSDIDYLGQFVKAWLAFNAWYRSAYEETKDRAIIEEVKWNSNPITSRMRPLLQYTSEEATQFRNEIGLLHHRLQNYEIHCGSGQGRIRITFSNIVIRTEPPTSDSFNYRNYNCVAERVANKEVTLVITHPNRGEVLNLQQPKFDLSDLEAAAEFSRLPDGLKRRCRRFYERMNPRLPRDLTTGDEPPITCGVHTFRCGVDFLFAGVVEVIYSLRCTLFHGELVPTREANECYEPAFRIVRRFLEAAT